ncbi:hypothetical protein BRC94_11135 [Halobacteriales archaeon QS_5_70_17]|nr:MAG: hypothetical protein BRC94_11135 [Halobacteriales archaeon QS_5_70_17]
MTTIRFEAADAADYTAIGEGLTRPARAAGRLATDRADAKYALVHGDGCGVCGRAIEPGDAFYLDVDSGDVLCEDHGRERRADGERDGRAE